MFEIIWNAIADNVFEIIAAIISVIVSYYVIPAIKNDLMPMLREKRIYSLVKKLVQAAEKSAESGAIKKVDKKAKVIEWLTAQGIEVTDEVEAFIESAVKELDLVTGTIIEEVKK